MNGRSLLRYIGTWICGVRKGVLLGVVLDAVHGKSLWVQKLYGRNKGPPFTVLVGGSYLPSFGQGDALGVMPDMWLFIVTFSCVPAEYWVGSAYSPIGELASRLQWQKLFAEPSVHHRIESETQNRSTYPMPERTFLLGCFRRPCQVAM